jgi:hypothetical protein
MLPLQPEVIAMDARKVGIFSFPSEFRCLGISSFFSFFCFPSSAIDPQPSSIELYCADMGSIDYLCNKARRPTSFELSG